jgi:hypothetical protein
MKARSMSIPDIDSTLPAPMKQQKTYKYVLYSEQLLPSNKKQNNKFSSSSSYFSFIDFIDFHISFFFVWFISDKNPIREKQKKI